MEPSAKPDGAEGARSQPDRWSVFGPPCEGCVLGVRDRQGTPPSAQSAGEGVADCSSRDALICPAARGALICPAARGALTGPADRAGMKGAGRSSGRAAGGFLGGGGGVCLVWERPGTFEVHSPPFDSVTSLEEKFPVQSG